MVKSGKSKRTLLCVLLCGVFFLEACASPYKKKIEQNNFFSSSTTSPEINGQLPLETAGVAQSELNHFYEMGAQFLYSGTADPYQLAETIYQYRDQRNSVVFESSFSSIANADPALLIEIASARAPHIDLYSENFLTADPQHQPVRALFDNVQKTSGAISMISYGEDVRNTAKALFDGHLFEDGNGYLVRYNAETDLYYLPSSPPIITEYPVIISADPLEGGGWNARAIVLSYWDSYNTWACPDGRWQSGENSSIDQVLEFVSQNLENLPQYVYTLLPDDAHGFRLDGFQEL